MAKDLNDLETQDRVDEVPTTNGEPIETPEEMLKNARNATQTKNKGKKPSKPKKNPTENPSATEQLDGAIVKAANDLVESEEKNAVALVQSGIETGIRKNSLHTKGEQLGTLLAQKATGEQNTEAFISQVKKLQAHSDVSAGRVIGGILKELCGEEQPPLAVAPAQIPKLTNLLPPKLSLFATDVDSEEMEEELNEE